MPQQVKDLHLDIDLVFGNEVVFVLDRRFKFINGHEGQLLGRKKGQGSFQ